MSTSKHIDQLCLAAAFLALLLTFALAAGERLGVQPASRVMGYETRLFDTAAVHTVDIVMDDWEGFLETCENEEYTVCDLVIDNEAYQNVGIRAKGNTSLSSVSQMGSQRYSFKIEFDHYDSAKTYHGLDKLCLNNLIQDNTMLKDYLTYQMMGAFGAAAPLCSFVYITVNGEDWGLYLAVEGVEDAFLQRNYGSGSGELYKPDSLSMGGGPGNGRNFDMEDFAERFGDESATGAPSTAGEEAGGFAPPGFLESAGGQAGPDGMERGGFGGGMGSDDAKLQYIDDDPESYSAIFDSAKTDVTTADRERLIAALKALGEGDVENSVDIDQVLRYFVVHNFVVNGDSYTGSMVHNYYLYEEDGLLSMIPWDYNLAFGGFQSADASAAVNDPIDTPLSVTGDGTRPMADWIFRSEAYTALYHQYFAEFLETVDITGLIDSACALIAPYVERDPTKFCTAEEFELGVETLRQFCQLRTESVSGQLDGSIPATSDGQRADGAALVDASGLTLSDMGSMGSTMGGGFGGRGGGQKDPERSMRPDSAISAEGGGAPSQPDDAPETRSGAGEAPETGNAVQTLVPEEGTGQMPAPGGEPQAADGEDRSSHEGRMPQGSPALDGLAGQSQISRSVSRDALLLLGASALVLLAGLAAAFAYKRRGSL